MQYYIVFLVLDFGLNLLPGTFSLKIKTYQQIIKYYDVQYYLCSKSLKGEYKLSSSITRAVYPVILGFTLYLV